MHRENTLLPEQIWPAVERGGDFRDDLREAAVCTLVEECQQEAVRLINQFFNRKKTLIRHLCRKIVMRQMETEQAFQLLWNENDLCDLKKILRRILVEKFPAGDSGELDTPAACPAEIEGMNRLVNSLFQEVLMEHFGRWCFEQLIKFCLPGGWDRLCPCPGGFLWRYVDVSRRREKVLLMLQQRMEGWLENNRLRLINYICRALAQHIFAVLEPAATPAVV